MPNIAPAVTGAQEVSVKMQVKPHVLAKATDITVGFLVANGPSGPFTELSELAEANKKGNEQTKVCTTVAQKHPRLCCYTDT